MDVDEIVKRLYRRFLWLDGKIDLYDGDEGKQLKYVDQWTKVASSLRDFLKMRGVEVEEEDLAKLLEKIPSCFMKKIKRLVKGVG